MWTPQTVSFDKFCIKCHEWLEKPPPVVPPCRRRGWMSWRLRWEMSIGCSFCSALCETGSSGDHLHPPLLSHFAPPSRQFKRKWRLSLRARWKTPSLSPHTFLLLLSADLYFSPLRPDVCPSAAILCHLFLLNTLTRDAPQRKPLVIYLLFKPNVLKKWSIKCQCGGSEYFQHWSHTNTCCFLAAASTHMVRRVVAELTEFNTFSMYSHKSLLGVVELFPHK